MEKAKSLDAINREILRILSLYKQLSLSDLWFEIGEAGVLKQIPKGQVSNRLESLMAQGVVERVPFEGGDARWAIKRSVALTTR